MVKKPFIIFVAMLVFAYGLEAVRLAITYDSYLNLLLSGVSFIAAISLLLNKFWSQYLIYFLALLISGFLIYATVVAIKNGSWPYDTLAETIISLIPAASYIAASIGCGVVVYRHFRERNNI